ncbi:MAG: NifU family protein [Hydrogenothermaceae bacterium]|nr:NifU family protein [Hydrogenothermaceae bacterium]
MVISKEQEIEEILEKIRPALVQDAGNIELVKVEDGDVYLKLHGTCQQCPVADITMKELVIYTIQESLPWVKAVYIGEEKYQIA